MKILPDNEEIALVRYGDGKYKADYIFTTSGFRDIRFSASAPFCIPAEINGNRIEIKEEDYELKNAVEKFASDNIKILNATRNDASNLSIAGNYFFSNIDKDGAEGVAKLIANGLATITADTLYPSQSFATWIEKITRESAKITSKELAKMGYDGLAKYFANIIVEYLAPGGPLPKSPYWQEFRTYLHSNKEFRGEITEVKDDLISNLNSASFRE
ncbi:hypothetical protein DRO22_03470 [Candidatus Bathyarchaeota archaeon]|nr:MAG: hypothetical protein DRO22_03470 [Candidatus Bathyarchaeota archaeon]